jgi:hypothetical protein
LIGKGGFGTPAAEMWVPAESEATTQSMTTMCLVCGLLVLQGGALCPCFVKGCPARFHALCAAKEGFSCNLDFYEDEEVRAW